MSLSKSILLIRDYNNIRQILRDVYIYGCFSRDDFIEKGIGGRKYDNEQRRISAYLPDKFIQKRRLNKRVLLYCSYDMKDSAKNYLAETYRNKSFTLLDVMSYFFVLQYLSDGEAKSLPEMLDEESGLPNFNEERMFTKDNLRIKLDELLEQGLIQQEKIGKNIKYRIKDDIWKDFSDDELEEIYLYLEHLKNTSPIEMPYYFLQRKLALYLECVRGKKVFSESPFLFKHNHMFNVLDNDVMLEILRAIHDCKCITIDSYGKKGEYSLTVIPVKLVHDSTYGRQYLIYADPNEYRLSAVRLDKIISASCARKMTEKEADVVSNKKAILDNCWCTSGLDSDTTEVEIKFFVDEEKEKYILRRINREGHGGSIDKVSEGEYVYRIKVRDPMEMIPWIRSFGERAVVVSSGDYPLKETMKNDWAKAVTKYESLS